MAHSLPATPLSLRRRLELLIGRLIMAVFALIDRLRPLPPPPSEVSLHRYGTDPAETLQYIARRPSAPALAPIVYMHGGGWILGNKKLYTRELFAFAEAGHPVFNLGYPVAPENPHPGILLSLLNALAWIRAEHPEVEEVHFMGDSAGGNLAMMLGILNANRNLLAPLGIHTHASVPIACSSVVSLYGVLDRLSWVRTGFPGAELMLECYAGKAGCEARVAPERSITPMDLDFETHPPSFLICGSKDHLLESTRICAERLEAGPGLVETKIYDGEMHGFFNMHWRPHYVELKDDILAFLKAHDPLDRSAVRNPSMEVSS